MRARSLRRGHEFNLTKEEFYIWLEGTEFNSLYDYWLSAGCNINDRPTVDRLKDEKGYTLSNMQILTYLDNVTKGPKGLNSKAVIQLDLDGEYIAWHSSAMKAAITLGKKDFTGILRCISGRANTAFGFNWVKDI